jgi:RHS repeat-associated protein
VRTVTGEYGQLEERYEYDAFGKPYQGKFDQGLNLGYTGKPYDTATGLYDYGYRDYAPEAARFTTADPVRDGTNWFAYVNNDPVNYIDPWGLECISTSDAAYRQQKVMSIIWHEDIDTNNKSTEKYSGAWRATDPDGYVSSGIFSDSSLSFDKIPNTTGVHHSIAGAESIQNVRILDIIQGNVGANITITQDNRPTRDYSTSSEWYNTDGSIKWPDNDGFANNPVAVTLPAGTQIDRYGGTNGKFASSPGTPYNERSMPPGSVGPYSVYTILQDIENVRVGTTAPAFGQPGGGVQYLLPDTINNLDNSGFIRRIGP